MASKMDKMAAGALKPIVWENRTKFDILQQTNT